MVRVLADGGHFFVEQELTIRGDGERKIDWWLRSLERRLRFGVRWGPRCAQDDPSISVRGQNIFRGCGLKLLSTIVAGTAAGQVSEL